MATHVTPAQRKEILRLKAQNYTNIAIAERLGIDRHTVGRHSDTEPARDQSAQTSIDNEKLAYLLAGLNKRGACKHCGQMIWWNATERSDGVCNWCGHTWALAKPQRPSAA